MSRKARKRATRRDRRKAKQSGYKREPKQMGSHVGHGSSGGIEKVIVSRPLPEPRARAPKKSSPVQYARHLKGD